MRHVLILGLVLAGCAPWPELARAPRGDAGTYPSLAPLDTFETRASAADPEADTELLERAKALEARADALRGEAMSEAERAEMLDAAERHRAPDGRP